MDSILNSIKKLLGISEDYEHFDGDIIIHINSVLATLKQMGIGPTDGFSIADENSKWSDFIQDSVNIENVKSYIYFKVRLMFDPPSSSSHMECIKQQISELEWRLSLEADK